MREEMNFMATHFPLSLFFLLFFGYLSLSLDRQNSYSILCALDLFHFWFIRKANKNSYIARNSKGSMYFRFQRWRKRMRCVMHWVVWLQAYQFLLNKNGYIPGNCRLYVYGIQFLVKTHTQTRTRKQCVRPYIQSNIYIAEHIIYLFPLMVSKRCCCYCCCWRSGERNASK